VPALVADVERTWRSRVVCEKRVFSEGGGNGSVVGPERDGARGHVRFIRKIELPIVIVRSTIVESEAHVRKLRLRPRRIPKPL